jgi:Tol biopolymer transport system component
LLLARRFVPAAGEPDHVRFEVSIPPIPFLPNLSISPDGRRIVFGARTPAGHIALLVRSLDSPQPRYLPGTEGVRGLFWSPDSRHVGFVANGKLKRIDLSGDPPVTVCDSADLLGGTWNADGVIVFGRADGPLMRVSASGGEPAPVTQLDKSRGELAHGWPVFLPDGRRFLYLAAGMELRNRAIYAGSLDSPARTEVVRANARPRYATSGHLLFHRDTSLLAQPFDVERLTLTGEPTRIAEGVIIHVPSGFAAYDISHTGTLVYRRQPAVEESTLTWFDRTGRRLETVGAPGVYRGVALSPDNRRIALHLHEVPEGGDIWVVDRDRAAFTKLTFRGHNWRPVWSPDGRFIAFSSTRAGDLGSLYRQASNGAGDAEILLKKEAMAKVYADDWASDGQSILYSETTRDSTGPDIGVVRLNERERTPKLLVSDTLDQGLSKFSPDGSWIAYESSESGRREIYVRPYAEGSGKWQISTDGGRYVRWARHGRELFYVKDDGSLMVADVFVQEGAFRSGTPRLLFKANPVLSNHSSDTQLDIPYDVTRDGQRFLFTERLTSAGRQTSLTIVLNRPAALQQ